MKADVYNKEGKSVGSIELPESVFGYAWKPNLVHQVVVSMQSNARINIAHAKDRSDVRGGGRKPWRQKGTGRARHGSIRSPIWRGGGATFGPRNERDFGKKINRKMRATALFSVLSKKLADEEVIFVEGLSFEAPKTSEGKAFLDGLSKAKGNEGLSKKRNAALIVVSESDANVKKTFRNFGNHKVEEYRNLNPVDLLTYKYVIISNPKEAIAFLEAKLSTPATKASEKKTIKKEKVEAK